MQGVYVIYTLTKPTDLTSTDINIKDRRFFKTGEERQNSLTDLKKIERTLYDAIGSITYTNDGRPENIIVWEVPPSALDIPDDSIWSQAFYSHAECMLKYIIKYEANVKDTSPLYSKIFLDEKSQIILYMTLRGDSFILLEFKNNLLEPIIYCSLDTNDIHVYPIIYTPPFDILKNLYSFRFTVDEKSKILYMDSLTGNIEYKNTCLIKPIIQTRGFCYYHSILHGLLISNRIKSICCKKLLEYMYLIQKNKTPYSLNNFMNTDICEEFKTNNLLKDTQYYVMKFFYQYLFEYENAVRGIIRQNNTEYLSKKPIEHIHPVEILAYQTNKSNVSFENMPMGGYPHDTLNILLKSVLNMSVSSLSDLNGTPNIYYQYIIYEKIYNYRENMEIQQLPDYTLMFGIIVFIYEDNSKNHAIIGIICNNVKYILDSKNSYYSPCDWDSFRDDLIKNDYIQKEYMNKNPIMIDIFYYFISNKLNDYADSCKKIKNTFIHRKFIDAILKSSLSQSLKNKIIESKEYKRLQPYKESINTNDIENIKLYEIKNPEETWTFPTRRGGARMSKTKRTTRARLDTLAMKAGRRGAVEV